jgi:hypothetical protein
MIGAVMTDSVDGANESSRIVPVLGDGDLGKWSQSDGTAYETAEWVLGAAIAECTANIASGVPPEEGEPSWGERRESYAGIRNGLYKVGPRELRKFVESFATSKTK